LQVVDQQLLTNDVQHGMSGAFRRAASRVAAPNQSESRMKKDRKEAESSEPLGIIISRGDRTEPTPVFSAYIWGPVPNATTESATRAA
jgi:hypothetical protein